MLPFFLFLFFLSLSLSLSPFFLDDSGHSAKEQKKKTTGPLSYHFYTSRGENIGADESDTLRNDWRYPPAISEARIKLISPPECSQLNLLANNFISNDKKKENNDKFITTTTTKKK